MLKTGLLAILGLMIGTAAMLSGCAETGRKTETPADVVAGAALTGDTTPAPLEAVEDPYALAGTVELPAREARNEHGLVNVYRLSDSILSGSEPATRESLAHLASLGVKTIISVDGKAPDVEGAARHGMRYVHVPIQYRTITDDEVMSFTKTFRECEGPFYVHCFHGHHRGPAVAALGRIVCDAAPRERALAEMRQYFHTSEKYRGLYEVIASGRIPSQEESHEDDFDFASRVKVEGMREAMVVIPRIFDVLKDLAKRDFAVDAAHPDVSPRNEAQKLAQAFRETLAIDGFEEEPDDFRAWMNESAEDSRRLSEIFAAPEPSQESLAEARRMVENVSKTCSACHAAYRNG